MNIKPEKKIVRVECSLCGEEWDAHGDKPTTLDCIRLLKAKATKVTYVPTWVPQPVPVYPARPYWGQQWYTSTGTTSQIMDCSSLSPTTTTNSTSYRTPVTAEMN